MNDDVLLTRWQQAWRPALAQWSRFTRLPPPTWLRTEAEEEAAGLSATFAMIRLSDHAVVVSLRQIAERGLGAFALEILAHEIGHHVLAPADLSDHGRLLARLRAALPGHEGEAAFVGNLYTDLLINDRLARSQGLDLPGLYRTLRGKADPGRLWNLYMRIYEQLWSLPTGTLTCGELDEGLRLDGALGARLVRAYARHWLDGAGRFAALLYPYLQKPQEESLAVLRAWLDATEAGTGGEIPDGLAEIEEAEITGALDPREDDELSGIGPRSRAQGGQRGDATEGSRPETSHRARGGMKRRYRGPREYTDLMGSLGVKVERQMLVMRYYRELARRHLIPFPRRRDANASDPLPEGLAPWDPGEPLPAVDWLESLLRSPWIIPGVTTLQRSFGQIPGAGTQQQPLDLYLGVDCSGSMVNPAWQLSYPVLAGTVIALSALRAGARVMACLSGEYDQTRGFVRSEALILRLLTSYLGSGYAFGVGRLEASIVTAPKHSRPVHLLIISDADLFQMLDEYPDGWQVAEKAVAQAGGGATALLNLPYRTVRPERRAMRRLAQAGWTLHQVSTEEEMVSFARAFARRTFIGERMS